MPETTPSQPKSLMDFVKAAKASIEELDPKGFQKMLAEDSEALLVDVREASEHEQAHIANALLVPRGILEAAADPSYSKHVPVLAAARRRPVMLYCATGGRSALAAATLQLMGFERVYSLDGGITRWQEDGLPVVSEARYV